jgi:hypothetical protein
MSLASNATLYAGRSNTICYLQMVLLAPCCQTCRSMGLRDTPKTFDPTGSERNTFFSHQFRWIAIDFFGIIVIYFQ